MADTVRMGLVGTGIWAREAHGPALRDHPQVEFVGVWGRDAATVGTVAEEFRVTAFTRFDELLAAVDAIAIAVAPAAQPALAIEAAKASKHLVLEKPIAVSSAAAQEMSAAVRDNNVGSVVCFTGRWIPRYASWLAGLAHQGGWEGGRAEILSSAMVTSSGFENSPWRREWGALWDLGPHAVSMLHAVLGQVRAVSAVAGLRDEVHLVLRHASGVTSTASASMTVPVAAAAGHTYSFYGQPGRTSAPALAAGVDNRAVAYQCALNSLVSQATGHALGDPLDVRLGAHVVAVLEAATQSLASGTVQLVPVPHAFP